MQMTLPRLLPTTRRYSRNPDFARPLANALAGIGALDKNYAMARRAVEFALPVNPLSLYAIRAISGHKQPHTLTSALD